MSPVMGPLWISLSALVLFASSPALAREMDIDAVELKIGEHAVLVTQAHSTLEGDQFLPGEAETIERHFVEQDEPITLFEIEGESFEDEFGRDPASERIQDRLKRWRDRGLLLVITIPKRHLGSLTEGAKNLGTFFKQWPGIYAEEVRKEAQDRKKDDPKLVRRDWAWGIFHTAFQTTVKTGAWVAAPGVPISIAIGAGLMRGVATGLAAFYPRAFSKSFEKHLDPSTRYMMVDGVKKESVVSPSVHAFRRKIWNYSLFGLTSAAVVASAGLGWPAFLATLPPTIIAVEGRSIIGPKMNGLFFREEQDPATGKMQVPQDANRMGLRFNNLISCVAIPLATMDAAGLGTVLLDLGFYTVRTYTVATLSAYIALWGALKFFPKSTKLLMRWQKGLGKEFVSEARAVWEALKAAPRRLWTGLAKRARAVKERVLKPRNPNASKKAPPRLRPALAP